MSTLVKITLAAALILSIAVPFGAFAMGEKSKGRYKKALGINAFLFFGTLMVSAVFMFSGSAAAAEPAAAASGVAGMGYLAAALSTGCLLYTSCSAVETAEQLVIFKTEHLNAHN